MATYIRRREFIVTLGSAATWPLAARAQEAALPVISMTAQYPIPAGPSLDAERKANKPDRPPRLPAAWTATVLLSPFGVSDSPLRDSSQLIVGTIEVSLAAAESWMRVALYLTQNRRYYEFLFRTLHPDNDTESRHWYWIDSNPEGSIGNIYGPFPTTLRVPGQDFFADAQWGNSYSLMCTDRNKQGMQCDHWLFPPPGSPGHGSWYSFRRDTGNLFRILVLDSTNPVDASNPRLVFHRQSADLH